MSFSSCFTASNSRNNSLAFERHVFESTWCSRYVLQTQHVIPLCNLELDSKLIAAPTITSDLILHSTTPTERLLLLQGEVTMYRERGAGVVTPPQAPRHWPARGRARVKTSLIQHPRHRRYRERFSIVMVSARKKDRRMKIRWC